MMKNKIGTNYISPRLFRESNGSCLEKERERERKYSANHRRDFV